MIRQYSLKIDGDRQLAKNFRVREFACKDRSDTILIDDALVVALQQLRDYFNKPVIIGSGFRTDTYNARIGGARNSLHLRGMAADIDVGRPALDPLIVCMKAQALGLSGLGCYQYANGQSWSHIGSGATGKFWTQNAPDRQVYIDTFLPVLRKGSTRTDAVRIAQQLLARSFAIDADGHFGSKTLTVVKRFQAEHGLVTDGVIGPKTWAALFK